jgi:hypothetical protein
MSDFKFIPRQTEHETASVPGRELNYGLMNPTRMPTRRLFIAEGAALVASSFLSSCGSSGGPSSGGPTPTPTPTSNLSLVSISPTSPTALTPITVQLSGFDPTKPFTVAFGGQSQTPIRVDSSSGAIIIAAPANIDATAGATAAFSTTLSISQNGNTVSSPIQISDMPQLSDLGVPLGTISRAFLNYQAIVLGQSINAQQAISLLPKAGNPNNATLLANLKTQLLNVIRARNDIDRVLSNNGLSIPVGTGPGGIPLSFDMNSVTMMDRILAQSLLTGTNNGTVLPQVRIVRNSRRRRSTMAEPLVAGNSVAFWNGLTTAINTGSGAVSYLTNQQTLNSKDSSFLDQYLSNLSAYSSYLTLGATVVGLGLTVASLPVLAGYAGAVATGAIITGFLAGTAAMGNDAYNIYTDVSALVHNEPNASAAKLGSDLTSLISDGVTSYLNAEGMGGLNGVSTAVGPAFNSVFTQLYVATADGVALGAAALMESTGNLLVQKALSADSDTASSSIQSVSPSDFGLVTGMCTISNSQGPILSGLSGVGAGDIGAAPDVLTSIAAPDGTYELVFPLGSPDLTYNAMDIAAFDPVDLYDPSINTLTVLGSSSVVDLSGVNPNTPIAGPSFAGVCNDTDAGSPDGDDPDCD